MNPCKVKGCGKTDDQKPQCFKGHDYCCERHRKVLAGEPMQDMDAPPKSVVE